MITILPAYDSKALEGLTDKQQLFVQEYMIDLNATAAATRAGYSKSNASKIGSQLLDHKGVQNALEAFKKQRDAFMQERFKQGAIEAYECLIEIIRDKEGNTQHRVSAAKDLLNRAFGEKQEHKIEVNYTERIRDLDTELQAAFAEIDAAGTKKPDIIEVE